jgi:hypothetical protein
MIKALKVAQAFLVLWIVISTTFIFFYSDTLPAAAADPGVNVNVDLLFPTSSHRTVASTTLPITSTSYGDDPLAILEPIQMLRQYQKEHSNQALQQEHDVATFDVDAAINSDRKFLVAYYYGPDRAGNMLHNFFNSIIWAVVTNRTVLWEYYTDQPHANTVQDCEQYLKRHSWLPSYAEWSHTLHLAAPVPVRVRDMLSSSAQVVLAPQIRDIFPQNDKIDRVKWSDDPAHLLRQKPKGWLLKFTSSWNNKNSEIVATGRFRRLYARGLVFVYGMLFQECFTIAVNTTATIATAVASRPNPKPKDITIALHSRHTVAADDGSYITDEIACLQKLLPAVRASTFTPCWVYLMSDRPQTLELLSTWLLARNCTPVVSSTSDSSTKINTTTTQPSRTNEHGPRAGAGFLEDLIMASAARTGYIGVEARQQGLPARSSTALVLEKIEYDRTVEAVTSSSTSSGVGIHSSSTYHKLDQLNVLQRCSMPFRDETKGYTYGPGTPIFQRNETWIKQALWEQNEQRHREQRALRRHTETAAVP